MRLIHLIRQKPKSVRDQYAFFGALGVVVLIGGLWVLSLPSQFVLVSDQPRTANATRESTLFSNLSDAINYARQSASAMFGTRNVVPRSDRDTPPTLSEVINDSATSDQPTPSLPAQPATTVAATSSDIVLAEIRATTASATTTQPIRLVPTSRTQPTASSS